MNREARVFRKLIVVLAVAGASLPLPLAAQTVKVGLINSYTGFVAQSDLLQDWSSRCYIPR
jgi:hypothetical protein